VAFVAVYDANVLYPGSLCDLLIRLAKTISFKPSGVTPPFSEYTSGHSTQSGAWAEVMTSLFGDGYEFTDHTHDEARLSARTFSSFHQAAEETAVSRLYRGMHYRFANDNGLASGICVGREAAALPLRW
jgi:hypothetical protein